MKTTKIKTEKHTATEDAAARLEALRQEAHELEVKLTLARGTRDLAPRVGGELSLDLGQRIEAVLRVRPHSVEELARELKESAGKISAALKPMRKHLFNAGSEDAPSWFWIVSDQATAAEVNAAVAALVRFKPMRFPELLAATGARQGRVSGAVVAMQRDPKSRLVNLDTAMRARWFAVPEGIQLAKLKKR